MKNFSGNKIFALLVTLLVVVIASMGAYLAGSPSTVRMVNLDSRRVSDLQSIMNGVESYYQTRRILPSSLSDISKSQDIYYVNSQDPETRAAYEYRSTDTLKYELCATFSASSEVAQQQQGMNAPYSYPYTSDFWKHPAGRFCYALEVHPNPNVAPIVK